MSEVRFVCTDGGGHKPWQLSRWTVVDGRAERVDLADLAPGPVLPQLFVRSSHRNAAVVERVLAQGADRGLSTFDEKCKHCGRDVKINAERFNRLLAGLIAAGCVEFDVSRAETH